MLFFWNFGITWYYFFVSGVIVLKNRKKKEKNCTSKTHGKVIDILKHESKGVNYYTYSWHPVFEYTIQKIIMNFMLLLKPFQKLLEEYLQL